MPREVAGIVIVAVTESVAVVAVGMMLNVGAFASLSGASRCTQEPPFPPPPIPYIDFRVFVEFVLLI